MERNMMEMSITMERNRQKMITKKIYNWKIL
jgi:hypothetical protein